MPSNGQLPLSRLDLICKKIIATKFFAKGWGDVDNLKRLFAMRKIVADREKCNKLVEWNHKIHIGSEVESGSNHVVYDGHFESPMVKYLAESIPVEAQIARFQLILPKTWHHSKLKPICVHLAGTGDHFFFRRKQFMAKPLLRDYGIASIILENPFYGCRKPKDQHRSSLRNVSDIFIMGGCLILESIALFNWSEKMGFGPIGITGISMGGHNAALSGASWNKPCSIIPCLSWTTASRSFTEGVMKENVPWDILQTEYSSYGESRQMELFGMIHSPDDVEAFKAGQHFVDGFNKSIVPAIPSSSQVSNQVPTSSPSSTIEASSDQRDLMSGVAIPEKDQNVSKSGQNVPKSDQNVPKSDQNVSRVEIPSKRDAIQFMRGIMDECTHLGNFSLPVDPELAFIVSAARDGYVPTVGTIPLTSLWKGSTHRTIDTGHVAAILFKSDVFRTAIFDSFELNAQKYYKSSLMEGIKKGSKDKAKAPRTSEANDPKGINL